ncbi:uncharacterized protein LOC141528046 [Cotesia typhae]|uniref:uncharacterized protein LOC141528046 n=1 Tax=Cotesia typhae TaxID=2053667 RepID=UPI003D68C1ED
MKLKGTVSHVSIQPTKIQPIIVKFQNGKLQNNLVRKMKCGLFYDEREKKPLLGISNNHVVYKGHRPKNQLTYPMLAIHNKKTGNIKLIQAERWLVFPTTKKQLISNKNSEDNQNNLLNKEFGSKKVKRRTIQNSKMQISIDAVQDQLAETVSQIEVDQDDLKVETIDEKFSSLPPCNRTALVVYEVYNLEDIIPAEKLILMCENCDSLLQNEETRKAPFFASSLRRIDNDAKKKTKLAILEFINALSKWISINVREAKKRSSEISAIPEISDYVINTYSMLSANGRARPVSIRDKAVIHSIILALMVNDFKLDLKSFNEVFTCRLGLRKLTELARIVGTVPSKDNKDVLVLKIPLPSAIDITKKSRKK